jgi:hypothetical protein
LPIVGLLVAGASTLAAVTLAVVDDIAAPALHSVAHSLATISNAASSVAVVDHGFVMFVVALLEVVAVLALWMELIVRNVVLALLLGLAPLLGAVSLWPPARRLGVRAIETFVALAVAKLAIALVLAMGLGGGGSGPGTE